MLQTENLAEFLKFSFLPKLATHFPLNKNYLKDNLFSSRQTFFPFFYPDLCHKKKKKLPKPSGLYACLIFFDLPNEEKNNLLSVYK